MRSAAAEAPAVAPLPVRLATPNSPQPLELKSSPRGAPDTPRVIPAERNADKRPEAPVAKRAEQPVAIRAEQSVAAPLAERSTAPLAERSTAPVEPRVTAAGDPALVVSVERSAARAAELRRATLPERKVDLAAEPAVAAREELNAAPPVGEQIAATKAAEVSPPRETNGAREAQQSDVQFIFIHGSLVQAPLAIELPAKPGMASRPEGLRTSSLVIGALLLLMLMALLLYAMVS